MTKLRKYHQNLQNYRQIIRDGFRYMRFKDQIIEKKFRDYYNRKFKKWMSVSILIAISIFSLSGILDIIYVDNNFYIQIIRFSIIVPLLIIAYLLIISKIFPSQYIQFISIFSIILIAVGVLSIGLLQPNPMRDMYFNGLMLVQIYTFILSRLQFWKAVITGSVLYIMLLVALFFDKTAYHYTFIAHSFIFLSGMLILSYSSYLFEKLIRSEFLNIRLLQQEQRDLEKVKNKLEKQVHFDGLTGLYNHSYFHKVLHQEWQRNRRQATPLALLLIDMDNFKNVNDEYGHLAGDYCLKSVAKAISKSIHRASDVAFRYGGDEFTILIANATYAGIETILARFKENMRKAQLSKKLNIARAITVSIGVTIMMPTEKISANQMVKVADHALYKAKKSGRNRVIFIDHLLKNKNQFNYLGNVISIDSKRLDDKK